jgi:phosphodiesterase/alkaline phosphatase D-like protein
MAVLLAPVAVALALGSAAADAASSSPTASTDGASSVAYSTAVLHGRVNPRGQTTNYMFEYGPTRKYGSQSPLSPVGSGNASASVSQAIAGLQPLTTYHYRVVGVSATGAALGADRTFTTL